MADPITVGGTGWLAPWLEAESVAQHRKVPAERENLKSNGLRFLPI